MKGSYHLWRGAEMVAFAAVSMRQFCTRLLSNFAHGYLVCVNDKTSGTLWEVNVKSCAFCLLYHQNL